MNTPSQTPQVQQTELDWVKLGMFLAVVVCVLGVFVWLFLQYRGVKQEVLLLSSDKESVAMQQNEIDSILAQVQKHMLLPDTQTPVVATIVNAASLAEEQAFYRNAVDGDILLVYPEKALIYSPTRNVLINVGPVYVESPADSAPVIVDQPPVEVGVVLDEDKEGNENEIDDGQPILE